MVGKSGSVTFFSAKKTDGYLSFCDLKLAQKKQKPHCDSLIHTLRLTVPNRFYLSQGEYDEHK